MSRRAAFIALIDGENNLLCVHHTYGDRGWGIPGGYLDGKETEFEAAAREFAEEVGSPLPIIDIELMYEIYPRTVSTVFVCHLKPDAKNVKIKVTTERQSVGTSPAGSSREIDDCQWMTKKKIDAVAENSGLRQIFADYYDILFVDRSVLFV